MASIYRVYYPKNPTFRLNPDLKVSDVVTVPGEIEPRDDWRYIGPFRADDLEDLYYRLNVENHHHGIRSMSVGDVVWDVLDESLDAAFYQVDDIGFTEVPS
ncbi:MAG: YodL domain-containing protein [Methanoregulaceae archaeon]|nr:YodL domain-containing protein [Methanoregulaceae archaeon]